jgi:uncharacterized protein (DUF305 family)
VGEIVMNMEHKHDQDQMSPYPRFFLMLATSFIIMYTVMFLNVWKIDHVMLSLTRVYMAILMVAPMAISMMLFMRHMYKDKSRNMFIIVGSVAVFALSLWGLRSQVGIADVQYMKAMIPHHSSAILTSEKASITDPEVRQLADEIIKTQEEEIAQMKRLLERLDNE